MVVASVGRSGCASVGALGRHVSVQYGNCGGLCGVRLSFDWPRQILGLLHRLAVHRLRHPRLVLARRLVAWCATDQRVWPVGERVLLFGDSTARLGDWLRSRIRPHRLRRVGNVRQRPLLARRDLCLGRTLGGVVAFFRGQAAPGRSRRRPRSRACPRGRAGAARARCATAHAASADRAALLVQHTGQCGEPDRLGAGAGAACSERDERPATAQPANGSVRRRRARRRRARMERADGDMDRSCGPGCRVPARERPTRSRCVRRLAAGANPRPTARADSSVRATRSPALRWHRAVHHRARRGLRSRGALGAGASAASRTRSKPGYRRRNVAMSGAS